MRFMEIEVDKYLARLASDSARWKQLGRIQSLTFIEGIFDGLTGVGAITGEEALVWRELFIAPVSVVPAQFSSTGVDSMIPPSSAPEDFPHFIELIPGVQPAKELPGVCSFQILGVERYDAQVAVVWRMLPNIGPRSSDEFTNRAPFIAGPDMLSMKVTDDQGTIYQRKGGNSGGGGGERVGRNVFVPAPPKDAATLKIMWEEMNFEIPLGSSFD